MADTRYKRLCEKIEQALEEKPKRMAHYRAMKRGRDSSNAPIDMMPGG